MSGITIQCGKCKSEASVDRWIAGLPKDCFKCPTCGNAFRRQPRKNRKPFEPCVELVPMSTDR